MADQSSNDPLAEPAASSLIHRVKAHDEMAWRQLVRVYGALVWHWIRHVGLQTADGNNVFQEVFQAVAIGIGGVRDDCSFCGWLRVITRNKVADHFRRMQHDPTAAGGADSSSWLEQLPTPELGETETTETDELACLRRRALDVVRSEFEQRTWQMFWLSAVENQPTREVAEEFGVSPSAVRLAKSRILRRLRDELRGLEP